MGAFPAGTKRQDFAQMAGFFHKVAGHVDKLDAEGLRRHYRALTDQIDFFRSVFEALDEGDAPAQRARARPTAPMPSGHAPP